MRDKSMEPQAPHVTPPQESLVDRMQRDLEAWKMAKAAIDKAQAK